MQSADTNINISLIIKGCLERNPQSQKKLYEHFFGYGMSIALRYAANKVEGEEMFHDGMLKVFNKLEQYDPDQPFKYWLRKIIVNAAIDYHRKFQKYRMFDSVEKPDIVIDKHSSIPPINDEDDVLPIVQKLSPAYRVVFNLYVMEEYKHHEIAEMLGISIGTSKSNLSRAKAKLKMLWLQKKAPFSKMNEYG